MSIRLIWKMQRTINLNFARIVPQYPTKEKKTAVHGLIPVVYQIQQATLVKSSEHFLYHHIFHTNLLRHVHPRDTLYGCYPIVPLSYSLQEVYYGKSFKYPLLTLILG